MQQTVVASNVWDVIAYIYRSFNRWLFDEDVNMTSFGQRLLFLNNEDEVRKKKEKTY